jgi:hypothetical protein
MSNAMYEGFGAKVLRHLAGAESMSVPPIEDEKRQALLAGAAALDVVNLIQQANRGSWTWRENARLQLRRARLRLRAVLDGKDERIDQGG